MDVVKKGEEPVHPVPVFRTSEGDVGVDTEEDGTWELQVRLGLFDALSMLDRT